MGGQPRFEFSLPDKWRDLFAGFHVRVFAAQPGIMDHRPHIPKRNWRALDEGLPGCADDFAVQSFSAFQLCHVYRDCRVSAQLRASNCFISGHYNRIFRPNHRDGAHPGLA